MDIQIQERKKVCLTYMVLILAQVTSKCAARKRMLSLMKRI